MVASFCHLTPLFLQKLKFYNMFPIEYLRYRILDDYPTEPFTEVYWIKFQRINSARYQKICTTFKNCLMVHSSEKQPNSVYVQRYRRQ